MSDMRQFIRLWTHLHLHCSSIIHGNPNVPVITTSVLTKTEAWRYSLLLLSFLFFFFFFVHLLIHSPLRTSLFPLMLLMLQTSYT